MNADRAALVLAWLDERYASRSPREQREMIFCLDASVLAMLAGHHALGGFTDDEAPAIIQVVRTWLQTKAKE